MEYEFNKGDLVRVKMHGIGCHREEIGTITRITEQGDYKGGPGYKTSPSVGNGIDGLYDGFTGEESFALEKPSNGNFQEGDYIVILRPKSEDSSFIKNNWVYLQGGTKRYFYTLSGSDGEPVIAYSIEFKGDNWRYATQQEIEEYKRQEGPYSLDKKPEDKGFIKGKWYKHFLLAGTIAKFSHMEGSNYVGSEWIASTGKHYNEGFRSTNYENAYEVSIQEIKHLLPPDHPDIPQEAHVPNDKAGYNRKNCPFKVGYYVRYKGTKADGLWAEYFGSRGVIAGDVGVVSNVYKTTDIHVVDKIRPDGSGHLSSEDLELITEEEYKQGLRSTEGTSLYRDLGKITENPGWVIHHSAGDDELKSASVYKSIVTNKKKSISIF